MKNEISDQNLLINELKREFQLFKELMRAMRVSNPAMRAIADQMERDEVVRWSNSLARARVTRWGGMISTPDDALQVNKHSVCVMRTWIIFVFRTHTHTHKGVMCDLENERSGIIYFGFYFVCPLQIDDD